MESINGAIDRPTKRLKLPADEEDVKDSGGDVDAGKGKGISEEENIATLPPEVWAAVMDHLDYSDVLSCAATSKALLHDAMPLVKMLHIGKATQMNAVTSRRLRDVAEINIFSLLVEEEVEVDQTTVDRFMAFLLQFNKLNKVFFGGRDSSGGITTLQKLLEDTILSEASEDLIKRMIDQISEGYSSRYFSNSMRVFGLTCLYSQDCQSCVHACKTWPLEHVLNFEYEGSSEESDDKFTYNRRCGLDVCISRIQVESVLRQRPGGNDLLCSETRLFHLLGQGTLSIICSDEGEPLYIVEFFQEDLDEMKRVITSSGLDVSKLARDDVHSAIMRSFAKGEDKPPPPRKLCYISLSDLRDKVGLNVDHEGFNTPVFENGKNLLPQLIQGIQSDSTIREDCMHLLCLTLENENPPIQKAINLGLGLMPLLIDGMNPENEDTRETSSFVYGVVASIFEHGSNAQVQRLIKAGVISFLVKALGDEDQEDTVNNSAIAVGQLADKSTQDRDCALNEGIIPPLIEALEKRKTSGKSRVFERLMRISPAEVLVNISWALSNLCDGKPRPNFDLVKPCIQPLCSLLLDNELEDVLLNVCHTLFDILDRPGENLDIDIDAKVQPRLADLLLHSSFDVRSGALALFGKILEKNESAIDILVPKYQDNALPFVVSYLECTEPGTLSSACLVVRTVTQHNKDSIPTLMDHGCIELLCGVLLIDNPTIAKNGLHALTMVSTYHNVYEHYTYRSNLITN